MVRELLKREDKLRILAFNIRSDLGRLQVALMKENKHDISAHLGGAIERSEELVQVISDALLLKAQ